MSFCNCLVATVALAAEGLNVSQFNGHRFQIGATTTTAQAEIPYSKIQSLVHCKIIHIYYVCTTPLQLTSISSCLVSSDCLMFYFVSDYFNA